VRERSTVVQGRVLRGGRGRARDGIHRGKRLPSFFVSIGHLEGREIPHWLSRGRMDVVDGRSPVGSECGRRVGGWEENDCMRTCRTFSKVYYNRVRVKRVSIMYFEVEFAVETAGSWLIISWWRRARIIDDAKEAKKCDAQTSDSRDQNAGIQEDSASVVGNYDVIEQTYEDDEDGRRLEVVCSWLPLNPPSVILRAILYRYTCISIKSRARRSAFLLQVQWNGLHCHG